MHQETGRTPSHAGEAARQYLDRGWRVLPVRPLGKEPLINWKSLQDHAPTPEEVDRWFTQWPDANLAILTGTVSNLVVIDIDGPDGDRSLTHTGSDVPTLTCHTAKGRHLYFTHPGGNVDNRVRLLPGLDVRGDRGYVVAPPSVHETGHVYRWADDGPREPAPLPEPLLKLLHGPVDEPGVVREGGRNDVLARLAGKLLARGDHVDLVLAQCLAENAARFVPPLDPAEVQRTVRSIAAREARKSAQATAVARPVLQRMSDVTPQAIEWLWDGYIALGKLSIIDGDPGLGKSTLTLDLAARVSAAAPMPDGSAGVAGGVVLLSAEDGLADTVLPRLQAMGADVERVVALSSSNGPDGERPPTLPEDVPVIAQAIDQVHARLVVIDPVVAFLSGSVNSWSDQHARRALAPVAKLAEEKNVAVLLVRHLNKKPGQPALYRGGGSIGIVGAARAGFLVAPDPGEPDRRVLAALKNNLGPLPPSLAFRIKAAPNGSAYLVWDGVAEWMADDLLAEPDPSPELDKAKSFLRDLLRDGPVPTETANTAAEHAGISRRTLKRARKELGVTAARQGFGADGVWVLQAPSDLGQGE